MKKVSVVGLGYIGLPTAIITAQNGYQVYGFDVDLSKIEKINKAISPIIENGIENKLKSVIENKLLTVSGNIKQADIFLVAVPTPFLNSDKKIKEADLSYVFSAAKEISKVLVHGNLVILESTVPVGITLKFARLIEKESGFKLSKDFYVSHCPERVLPGRIFEELVSNDRVIGGICQTASELSKNFYSSFVSGQIYITDDKTAEMVKLAENSYRDLNIAYANELSLMAKSIGVDPFKLIELANKHPRVNILQPGCGVGGHCIAVDPWFLIQAFPKNSKVLQAARNINDSKPDIVIKNVLNAVAKIIKPDIPRPRVLALGLTFKPDVDDLRGSPALKIAAELNRKRELFDFAVLEPNLGENMLDGLGFKRFYDLYESVKWADLILILVKHSAFYEIKNFDLKNKVVIDECGLIYKLYELKSQFNLDFGVDGNRDHKNIRGNQ